MTKARAIRLEDEIYKLFGEVAKEEGRTQNGLMKYLLSTYIYEEAKKKAEKEKIEKQFKEEDINE